MAATEAYKGELTVWGIHGGKGGRADELFLKHKVIAIGWSQVGDLGRFPDRESLKAALAEALPDYKPAALPGAAGLLFRFVHEMQVADLVVYSSAPSKEVWVGRITGLYEHRPDISSHYPNQRKVEWLRHAPRTEFTQGALYEIGSALTLFQVRNYAEEWLAFLEGGKGPGPDGDETVALVAENIEEQTRDFVVKQLARHAKGHPLAELVADLLEAMGYNTRVSAPGPDHGVDILAHPDELGFQPPLVRVQVKSTEGSVGEPDVARLVGVVGEQEYGLFVTLGTFTPQARSFAVSRRNLRLIDGDELVHLIFEHYDALDARFKGIIPLKRSYIPEVLVEGQTAPG